MTMIKNTKPDYSVVIPVGDRVDELSDKSETVRHSLRRNQFLIY